MKYFQVYLMAWILVTFAGSPEALCIEKLTASIAEMPVAAESMEKGVFVDLCKAITSETGIPIDIHIVPFARSMRNVIQGDVDFHVPLIQNPYEKVDDLPFDYSIFTIFHTNFVLYTNKNKPVRIDLLGFLKIETERTHSAYFPFKTIPSSCIECSLKKVQTMRIDGFIFQETITDYYVRKNHMIDIRRQFYQSYDVKIALPKGSRGGPVDQFLSQALSSLEKKGKLKIILNKFVNVYNDWQP